MIAPLMIVSRSIGKMLLDIARTTSSNVSQLEVELSSGSKNCTHGTSAFSRQQHSLQNQIVTINMILKYIKIISE
jgi:hypothetical protein